MVPMSIKVLVFESDSAFAGELRNELGNLGCTVRIVDDGNVGLQQAQAERPDLILLSIELPRMNGFSVCNKLKKDPDLKDVPLIIMSSESSDETFEQHKKLRTRAEAYVHKPIAFGQLLQEIDPFVALRGDVLASTGDTSDADDMSGIVIDDDDPPTASVPPPPAPAPRLPDRAPDSQRTAMFQVPTMPKGREPDADVDAFDDAFALLQVNDEPAAQPARQPSTQPPATQAPPSNYPVGASPSPMATRPPPSTGGAARASEAAESAARDSLAKSAELDQVRAELGAASGELDTAKGQAKDLEKRLLDAQAEVDRVRKEAVADAERLKRELEELRSRPAPAAAVKGGSVPPKAGGGITSREFLDLREGLSKKDKEILALKQQLTAKDREIYEIRDRSLAHETRVQELDDRVLEKDRELAEASERIEDLSGQLESTKKALADTQTQLDRTEKELGEVKAKRDQENVTHEAASAAAKADRADSERRLKEEHAAAMAKAEAAYKNELDAAEAAHIAARDAAESASTSAREAAEAASTAARETAEAAFTAARDAAESARDQAARDHAAALAKQASDAAAEHAAALAKQTSDAEQASATALAAREAALKAETDAKLASLHRSQQDELQRLRTEAEVRETALSEDLRKTKARLEDIEKQLADVTTARTTLDSQLGTAASKAAALEEELSVLRGELADTRKDLVRESSRATRALAKWDADKASLERAKDALAVALSQLDEAEARQISE